MKSGKQKRAELKAKKAAKWTAAMQAVNLVSLSSDVAVNRSQLAEQDGYREPDFVQRGYYIDKEFLCQSCGEPQTWTAAQQKWWYEVAKGGVFATARLCRPCRRREQDRRAEPARGDPNPYKNASLLLARVRTDIEPELLKAGFAEVGRNNRNARRRLFIDYGFSDGLFSVSWDNHDARLRAELLTDGGAEFRVIAEAEFDKVASTADIDIRLSSFKASVRTFLTGLRESPPQYAC
jgi:hypothetical protein